MARVFIKAAQGVLQHFPWLRRRARKSYHAKRRRAYEKLAAGIAVDEHTVLFASFGGRQYCDSPRAIYERMLESDAFADFTFIWVFMAEPLERYAHDPRFARAQLVLFDSPEYWQACAQAKYWVFNSRIAEYCTRKPEQVYVQCWHGTPLKRLGFDVPEGAGGALNTASELAERFLLDTRKWSYLVSPSGYATEHLASAFGLPPERIGQVVLEEGYPRNDVLARVGGDAAAAAAFQAAFKQKLGIPADKKLLLYAPTWRDDSYKAGVGYVLSNTLLDFDALHEALADEWCILFRAHYYILDALDLSRYEGFSYDVSAYEDINDLYLASDCLATDYSSVFFDYANLGRPMLFHWPDAQHYGTDVRGFYLDLSTIPGPHCANTAEFIEAVQRLDAYEERYGAEATAFRQRFCPHDDGHAAERVIARVFGE